MSEARAFPEGPKTGSCHDDVPHGQLIREVAIVLTRTKTLEIYNSHTGIHQDNGRFLAVRPTLTSSPASPSSPSTESCTACS